MWSILNVALGVVFFGGCIQFSQNNGIAQRLQTLKVSTVVLSIFFFHSETMSINEIVYFSVCLLFGLGFARFFFLCLFFEVAVSTFTTISLRITRKRSLQLLQFHQWRVIYNDERNTLQIPFGICLYCCVV